MMRTVAVLFARADSNYKQLPECDVYDEARGALTFPGGLPVIAHPPCRGWGSLRHFAKPAPGELDLAPWAIEQVRRWGGVLEHPRYSQLWTAMSLPAPGRRDKFGGFTVGIDQNWFGHRAEKRTLLYVCGCAPTDLPPIPLQLGRASHVVAQPPRRKDGTRVRKGALGWRPEVTPAEREHTPMPLARWLVELAESCPIPYPEFA